MSHRLSEPLFTQVISATPLVSIDLIVRDSRNRVLLGYRLNKPAQHYWFVPGGRVRKDELLESAFLRLTRHELGIELQRANARFLGVYQHLYDDNALDAPDVSTHYVVLGYEVKIDSKTMGSALNLEEQHADQRWWEVKDLLSSDAVHSNTKAYFDASYCQ